MYYTPYFILYIQFDYICLTINVTFNCSLTSFCVKVFVMKEVKLALMQFDSDPLQA